MAQKETSHVQNMASSALSADAESFIPRHGSSAAGSQPVSADGESLTQHQLSQLPRFMTSCYPFVKNDSTGQPAGRGSSPGSWHGPGRPRAGQYHKQLRPGMSSPTGAYGFNQRGPSPRAMASSRSSTRPVLSGLLASPRAVLPSRIGLSPAAGMPGIAIPPSVATLSPQGQPALNPVAPCINPVGMNLGQPALWTPQLAQEFPAQYPGASMFYAPYQYSRQDCSVGSDHTRSTEKKKKKGEYGSNMISIGIQNESGVQHNPGTSTKRKAKPKTIICKNADTQTDFSDEIANLTLAEKPCPLYQKDHHSRSWLQHYNQDSSTDSEEKDSDSGYSSPQHRRNQANSGTHPVVGPTAYLVSGVPTTIGLPPPPAPGHPGPGLLPLPPTLHPPFVPTSLGPYNGLVQPVGGSVMAPTGSCYQRSYQSFPSEVPALVHHGHQQGKHDPIPGMVTSATSNNSTPMKQSPAAVAHPGSANTEPEDSEASSGKRKRRRGRRKNKSNSGDDVGVLSDDPYFTHRPHSSSSMSRTSTVDNDLTLHFDDENEFPNLLSAAGGLPSSTNSQSSGPISYSDILKNQTSCLSQESSLSGMDRIKFGGGSETQSTSSSAGKESKNARKRRKRREMASRAADEELAEISLEQTVLKELRSKSHLSDVSKQDSTASKPPADRAPSAHAKTQPAGKKSKQPISLNFADMISALEKQQEESKTNKDKRPPVTQSVNKVSHITVANPLDTSAPAKRGKEREVPKVKKPSPLKKVILKEREEKKRLRLLEDANPLSPGNESSGNSQLASVAGLPFESDLSQEAGNSKPSGTDFIGTPVSAEMSPISQMSPISMSPLSGSPLSSGVNSPIASNTIIGNTPKSSVLMKIHSRRFREYCNQVLDKSIDECCTLLLQDLVRFQDRLYHKDPTKAKAKRRIVLGLREVTKHLKLNRIKCVIISPNMERIQSKGGLDEALNNILDLCTKQDVPFVFALGRRALGRACAKLVPVSVAGIFNYEGTEENFKRLMTLSEKARNAYKEMVALLEQEMEQQPHAPTVPATSTSTGNLSHLFAHLGHSRTPSACSAISFTSSILSEPISENYPHSEPETDSRGYEIVADNKDSSEQPANEPSPDQAGEPEEEGTASDSLQSSQEKVVIVESLYDIGHEADNEADEDDVVSNHQKKASASCASVAASGDYACNGSDSGSAHRSSPANSVIEKDDVRELPHIDSIHSMTVDISAEILSQHSSKTLDLNTEVLSTHSSKTLEAERCGHATPDRLAKSHGSAADQREASVVAGGTGVAHQKTVDNQERVQSWVVDSQKHLHLLTPCPDLLDEHITNNNLNMDVSAKCCSIKDSSCTDAELPETDSSCNTCINMQSVIAGVDKLTVSAVSKHEDGEANDLSCDSADAPVT